MIRIADFFSERRIRAHLSLALTRDLFIRYTEVGEVLFINAVLIASHRPVIITGFTAILRHQGVGKSFRMNLLRMGQPADRGTAMHQHYFFSSSPTDLIPVDQPIRRIYMLAIDQYDSMLSAAFVHFKEALTNLEPAMRALVANASDERPVEQAEVRSHLTEAIKKFVDDYVDGVQLEQATYTVEVTVSYREAKKQNDTSRDAVSHAEFTVALPVKLSVRPLLARVGESAASAIVDPRAAPPYWPEFAPRKSKSRRRRTSRVGAKVPRWIVSSHMPSGCSGGC